MTPSRIRAVEDALKQLIGAVNNLNDRLALVEQFIEIVAQDLNKKGEETNDEEGTEASDPVIQSP